MVKSKREFYCDILIITDRTLIENRLENAITGFGFTYLALNSIEAAIEQFPQVRFSLIIIDINCQPINDSLKIRLQNVMAWFRNSNTLLINELGKSTFPPNDAYLLPATIVLSENDYLNTSKLEFLIAIHVGGEYITAKTEDFVVGTTINFPVYHLLTKNRKFIVLIPKGILITKERIAKLNGVSDLFIRYRDNELYNKYLLSAQWAGVDGLIRRTRAQFRHFTQNYQNLILEITANHHRSNYEKGKHLYLQIQGLASELLNSLMSVDDLFSVLDHGQTNDLRLLLRAPERAAIAGYICVLGNRGDAEKAMIAALFQDLGVLTLAPSLVRQSMDKDELQLKPSDVRLWQSIPQRSVEILMNQKIGFDQDIKNIILSANSQNDGLGFPDGPPERIPYESQVLLFAKHVDQLSAIHIGKHIKSYAESFLTLLKSTKANQLFRSDILTTLRAIDLKVDVKQLPKSKNS